MSLFQSKVWWSTKLAGNEEFDAGHLAVGKFGTRDENHRVAVCSFDGRIRIFEPREGGYKPAHLLLEREEGKPILQVMTFKFRDEPTAEDHIAVLYPKGFTVYGFHQGQEGILLRNESREDTLDRLCYNMCSCFINGEGVLCIQSQDGMLFFYNRSSRLCAYQLQEMVVPSPLIFIKAKNAVVIQNSQYSIQSYRYNSIYGNTAGGSSGAKPEWETTVGELALSFDVNESGDEPQLVVGCEQHIYVLKSGNGKIDILKRLQCVPSTVLVNNLRSESASSKDLVVVVSSFSHHILFYKNFELVWATKTANVAHGLKLATFGGKKGLLVCINEEGFLDVIYLGVDVPQLQFQGAATRDQPFEELKKEAAELKGNGCLTQARSRHAVARRTRQLDL